MTTEICDICLKETHPKSRTLWINHSSRRGESDLVRMCSDCDIKELRIACVVCGESMIAYIIEKNFTKIAPGTFVCIGQCLDEYNSSKPDLASALAKAKAGRKVKWPPRDINW